MAYILAQTQWPSTPITSAVKEVIKNSFVCADDLNNVSRRKLGLRVMTPDCRLVVNNQLFPDREAILSHWDEVEDKFAAAAKHEVLKVWSFDTEGKDVLCLARVTTTLKSGGEVIEAPFAMQFQMEGGGAGQEGVRIRYIESVIDYAPFLKMEFGILKE